MHAEAPTVVTGAEVAATYDALAGCWESLTTPRTDPRPDWVRRIAGSVAAHEPVVELGCATGVPVGALLADRYRYIGVDVSRRMIERAGERLPAAAFTCADVTSVRFPSESLGAVIAFGLFPNLPRELHAGLLGEIGRWLRPGGMFVGSFTAFDVPGREVADWLEAGPMRWSGFDAAAQAGLFAAAGLEVLDEEVRDPQPSDGDLAMRWCLARRPL